MKYWIYRLPFKQLSKYVYQDVIQVVDIQAKFNSDIAKIRWNISKIDHGI